MYAKMHTNRGEKRPILENSTYTKMHASTALHTVELFGSKSIWCRKIREMIAIECNAVPQLYKKRKRDVNYIYVLRWRIAVLNLCKKSP